MKNVLRSLLFVMLCACGAAFADEHRVNSASAVQKLLGDGKVGPGDVIVWEDGEYANQHVKLVGVAGEEGAEITLRAETPGGVRFTGSSQMDIGESWWVIEGFYWDGGTGTSDHVEFRRSGAQSGFPENTVIRNCAFNNLETEGDSKSRWIVMYGRNNVVENCSFLNKESTGACILVELRYQNGTTAGHIIRNNYFYNFPSKDGRTNAGDSEAIRIGVSEFQNEDASVLVEGNYFVETDGENEIITNKSRNNRYLRNTFRRSRGSLVLRHGAGAWVEGNFFLGEGKAKTGGIRITDSDHVIINNYMEGLRNAGDIWNNGITFVAGNTASGGTSSNYQYVENVLVAFNTIYDSDDPFFFNDDRGSRKAKGIVANNLVSSSRGQLIGGATSQASDLVWAGNIMGGAAVGISNSGITEAEVSMAATSGIHHPTSGSAAEDAAVGDYPEVTADVHGRPRPLAGKDVGAHESTDAPMLYVPIVDADVGTRIGACFLDATGAVIPCVSGNAETWGDFPVIDGWADTMGWIGWVFLGPEGWVYPMNLDKWIYLPESELHAAGAWTFIVR